MSYRCLHVVWASTRIMFFSPIIEVNSLYCYCGKLIKKSRSAYSILQECYSIVSEHSIASSSIIGSSIRPSTSLCSSRISCVFSVHPFVL
jgi:hypothetical protein